MWFIVTYFVIVILVIEIATVLMRATGLDYDISRFQVVSMLTSTGFTTKESELILGHPLRRRLGIFLILFGIFSFAVIISSISSILVPDFRISYLSIIPIVLAVLLYCLRIPSVESFLVAKFKQNLEQKFDVHELPIAEVMLLSDTDTFIDIPIGKESGLIGQTLEKSCDKDGDINLLFIKRGTETVRRERLQTKLEPGDLLYVYGDQLEIQRLFAREIKEKETLLLKDEKKGLSMMGGG
ncbi:hypothetical protein SD71_08590 [Cohnella kolymensis]|uniref:RCK C-terminal domain-containing protein n=1 Tax=Cohnella kolymensis TaxID=1590652 RepID=A0ABR5A5L1_9BACL|nr:TrkA C-terminal domain-containing protein [Cohnella kolymensis]KIL36313.1 hypothetical protein SD71_08590 [Cohnella kolymensis]